MLKLNDVFFSYDPEQKLLQNINLSLDKGEHLCVMGESGCGKSTLLKIIYGLIDVDKGSLYWGDKQIQGPAYHLIPGMPFFKYQAQDYDLMPFTSVADNISKFLSRTEPETSERRTWELLEVIEMTAFAEQKVITRSGGQKQRVALARALAKDPELLLLDEPFSQVDNFKKNSLRRLLFSYLKEKNISCIVATHDGDDALSFADQMVVIQSNGIIASGTPKDLYAKPPNKYVASLFDDVNEVHVKGKTKLLYPHQVKIVEASDLKAEVVKSYFKGTYWLVEVMLMDQLIYLRHGEEVKRGEVVCLKY
jgi:ABC-type Fe3+/spermidine/putrescine transport system ATPase subunit